MAPDIVVELFRIQNNRIAATGKINNMIDSQDIFK